ncbi:MAG: hypothetical protein HXY28_01610 [Hydrogenophilaceae bacterium]|jgi:hypothetical protein|nr:hypothetical protein [Hydrogenophilaceae bacterium]
MTALAFPSIPYAPGWRARRRLREFRSLERLVVAFGAAASGFAAGALLAMAVGRVDEPAAVAAILLLFGFAFHMAAKSLVEIIRAGAWFGAALFALHMLAFGLWPFQVLLFNPASLEFWVGLAALLGTLAAFLWLSSPPARVVFRTSAQAALLAGLTAYQGVLVAIGT